MMQKMKQKIKVPKCICSRCDKLKPETELFCEDCVNEIIKGYKLIEDELNNQIKSYGDKNEKTNKKRI